MEIALILLVPFLGTVLGSGMVFFIKDKLPNKLEKFLLGFAAGVMMAASVWSLIIPSIEISNFSENLKWIPALVGFLVGIVFLLGLDSLIPHLHKSAETPEGVKSNLSRQIMLVFAVALHNLPEGMVVGVTLAGALSGNEVITLSGALILAIGIALQNFPEGAVVSFPLVTEGVKKSKAFGYGVLSAIVEPIGAIITMFLARLFNPILPYFLSFAAGAMIYVVVEELIPESQSGKHTNFGTIGCAIGFALMMVLDIALG